MSFKMTAIKSDMKLEGRKENLNFFCLFLFFSKFDGDFVCFYTPLFIYLSDFI